MLDLPSDVLDETLAFWLHVTGSTLSPWRGDQGEYATLVPADGDDFLRVQRFDAGPRVHLDLHVAADGRDPVEAVRAELVRALALGAALEHDAGTHVVLSSPGGYVFCLVRDTGHARRPRAVPVAAPARDGDGRACALVDQVCLDVPADRFDDEAAFWPALTGWLLDPRAKGELVPLERPAGMPLRILLQRLGGDDARRETTAHLDLATVARPAVERAHLEMGARLVARRERWTTLLDPSGHPYCLTARDPQTGGLRA